jgi:hypothetical protein
MLRNLELKVRGQTSGDRKGLTEQFPGGDYILAHRANPKVLGHFFIPVTVTERKDLPEGHRFQGASQKVGR